MYGISNSQQQGGGGGGAASYKAIKSTLTPSDWQEVTNQPYFVGENAMTWEVNENTEMPTKSQPTNMGLVAGVSYTITVVADNETYTSTSEAVGRAGGVVVIMFEMSNANMFVYDKFDVSTMSPTAEGSFCAVETTATNFVITNFEGGGFGTIIQAAISDSAIKVNSAITMYTNTSEKIAAGEKTSGSVTLTADSIPTASIPYSLEIVGTDTEGLFEIINGYIPEIPDTPSGVPQWNTIYEDTTGAVSVELSEPLQAGALYRITFGGDVYMFCSPDTGSASYQGGFTISTDVFQNANTMGHLSYNFRHANTSLWLNYVATYAITTAGITGIVFVDNTDKQEIKITKVEVYR